jgi:hypothetical protein
VTMKNSIFWDATSCGSCKNKRFRGNYRHHYCNFSTWWCRREVPPKLLFLQETQPDGTSQKTAFFNCLTYCGNVVSLTRRSRFTLQRDFWYSFLSEAEWTAP